MMDLTIHTYGHIDSMFYCLNAIAMLINSEAGEMLLVTMASVSVAYHALKISYAGGSPNYKVHIGKVIGMVAMMYFLLLPQTGALKTEMLIFDHVSKKRDKVDNLPLAFALPVGLIEKFGNLLTLGFEQAFTQVGNANYSDYGMVFGARLVQDSRNWRIRSPELLENMTNFMDRCVMVDMMIGHYYTPEQLLASDDILRLIAQNIGTLRQVQIRSGRDKTLMSCKKALEDVIEPGLRSEIEALAKKNSTSDFGNAGSRLQAVARVTERLGTTFYENVALSFNSYLGINTEAGSAANLIRQQMMINSLRDYSDVYGVSRASMTQESNWMIAGDLASHYLPILMSVLKVLVYSSFIFMLPLLILSGGWTRYLGYLTLVTSLQLWAPLNAVLSMFIDIYSATTISGIADKIVSFSTMSRVGSYADKIVAVASGLQMAIPFLAFSIMQGGVGGFIHLASTITGASQSAASQAASESVTGNKSFDNHSVGNQQLYNQSGFKTDWNTSYASGASTYQHADGTMEKVTGSGNILMQSGVGLTASGGATSYKLDDTRQAQVSEGTQVAESMHQQDLRSAASAKTNTYSKASDFVSHIAQRESAGESFNYEKLGDQGKALQQAVDLTKQLHNNKKYDWDAASQNALDVTATIGTPGILGSQMSASAKGSLTNTNSSNQSIGQGININRDSRANNNYDNIIKAASNTNWAKENSIDTGYSDSVRNGYEEQQRLESAASMSKQRVDDWHKAQTIIDSQSASSSKDMYQEVVDGIRREHGVDAHTAHNMADSRSQEAQAVWSKLQHEDGYVRNLVNNISHDREQVSDSHAQHKLDEFSSSHKNTINQDTQSGIKQHAKDSGMDIDNFKEGIQHQRQQLEQKHTDLTAENDTKYKSTSENHTNVERVVQQQIDRVDAKGNTKQGAKGRRRGSARH